ncbi:uncharacterized protein PFL1_05336 [Pseudozyma flocculosa PF-1]|uniref:Uncharacterized protein n=1 Tax=Pseudozyma flocculosa PF-1 TaxID=1277687 RepID=A0A061H2U7_9BASI|nr:uncharacterized protein PFL1_05336 [Pseudozyma flocculosa PF-1]EPQ27052.1 hypothetical protein PFL1_05336 [Pseudozyma flocculosa PF-1]
MGNDGGSIARRDELVRTKAVLEKADPETIRQALWSLCTLSRQPLRAPIVSDALGRLYNKDAVVHYLLHRGDRPKGGIDDIAAGHIRGLKDVRELKLTKNPNFRPPSPTSTSSESNAAPFICPLTSKDMNGKYRFVYLQPCGCVMSESGLRAIASEVKSTRPSSSSSATTTTTTATTNGSDDTLRQCPLCGTDFRASNLAKGKEPEAGGQVVVINPSNGEEDAMRKAMEAARAKEAARKAATKAAGSANGGGHAADGGEDAATREEKKRKKAEKKAAREAKIAALTAELAHDGSGGGGDGKAASLRRSADGLGDAERDGDNDLDDALTPSAKRAKLEESTRPTMSATAPGVSAAMRVAELTRQQNAAVKSRAQPVSAAIASLYGPGKDAGGKPTKESWMNRSTCSG